MDRLDPDDFLKTIRAYLNLEGLKGILDALDGAEVSIEYYDDHWDPYNNDITVIVKCPIENLKKLKPFKNKLTKICGQILEGSEYEFKDLLINTKLRKAGISDLVEKEATNNQTAYSSLLDIAQKISDPIESVYLIEACNCAKAGMNLAAATMLGCAAEQLLKNISTSYHTYLKNSDKSNKEIEGYESKVIKSKTSYMRLTNFYNYVGSNKKTFEQHGLENPDSSYAVLEIIRQTRNDSGHPTGNLVTDNEIHEIFTLYTIWLPRFHNVIKSFHKLIDQT